jgi:cytochrome P450
MLLRSILITCRGLVTLTPPGYPPDFRHSLWSLRRQAKTDPLGFLEVLADTPGDIVPFSLAGRPAFLLKHPDLVEAVLVTNWRQFVKAYGLQRAARLLGNGLLTAEGECHHRRRAVVQPAFHRRQLERYGQMMVADAVRYRDRWRAHQTVDVAAEASALTLAIVGRTMFGADVESLTAEVRQALTVASDALDPLISLLAPSRRVRPQRERLIAVIDDLIIRHRGRHQTPGSEGNLISLLLDSEEGGRVGPGVSGLTDQLRDDALTILLAGHDTIASALVWTWIVLAQQPGIEAGLEAEVDAVLGGRLATAADWSALAFTRRVLAESLRLYPPAWVVARSALGACELGGVAVPAGSIVLMSQHLIHRDPRYFPNPSVFDPDRWLDERQAGRPKMAYFPFGAGPRSCIGEGFAWMEGVLLLATFAQRWRFRLADRRHPIRPHPKITLRPPSSVTMVLHERAPL